MADLKTNYKDDVLNTSENSKRKYNMITNSDGTVSFEDVTEYSQTGDSFGSSDINNTNTAINELNSKLSHVGMIIHSTTLDTEAKVIAIYGGTKWTKIEGRFLLGQSSSYAVNSTGGEATHQLTASEMPAHTHAETLVAWGYDGWGTMNIPAYTIAFPYNASYYMNTTSTKHVTTVSANTVTGNAGGKAAHNNMPPYKAVYIWERVA